MDLIGLGNLHLDNSIRVRNYLLVLLFRFISRSQILRAKDQNIDDGWWLSISGFCPLSRVKRVIYVVNVFMDDAEHGPDGNDRILVYNSDSFFVTGAASRTSIQGMHLRSGEDSFRAAASSSRRSAPAPVTTAPAHAHAMVDKLHRALPG